MKAQYEPDAAVASRSESCTRIARRIRRAVPGDLGRYLGFDTVGMSFSVADADFDPRTLAWTQESRATRVTHRFRGEINGAAARIDVFEHLLVEEEQAHRVTAWVELSLGRLYDPSGWSLCPADQARAVLEKFLVGLIANGLMVPTCLHKTQMCGSVECMLATVRFTRADVAFDFLAVESAKPYVTHVKQQPHPRLKGEPVCTDTEITATTGLRYGRTVRLYDKHVETLAHKKTREAVAPRGTIRLEAQLRKSALRTAGLERLKDLDVSTLGRTLRDAYRWLGLAVPLGGVGTPAARILGEADLSPARQRTLLGAMKAAEMGYDRSPTSKWYRHALREYGLSPGTSLDTPSGEARHLCMQTGREASAPEEMSFHACWARPKHATRRSEAAPGVC